MPPSQPPNTFDNDPVAPGSPAEPRRLPPDRALSFIKACEYLGLTPDDFTRLREAHLIQPVTEGAQQQYRPEGLRLARALLTIGERRGWRYPTLAWFADLAFACEVGRSILLPLPGQELTGSALPLNWLESPYLLTIAQNLETDLAAMEAPEGPLIAILRSLTGVGLARFWRGKRALSHTALYPIITYYEQQGIPITGQADNIARDAGTIFLGVLMVFSLVAPPLSPKLGELVGHMYTSVAPSLDNPPGIETASQAITRERARIRKEGLVAVDKIYASKAPEIHAPDPNWEFKVGVVYSKRNTIGLQLKVPPETTDDMIDNILDLIRPYLGAYGARVIQALYQIANDPPYWRQPVITVQTNDLLDQLGQKRDERGIHRSKNRERLRDVLNAAHSLEIVGEYTTWESGKRERKAFFRTVLSIIGATYDPDETRELSAVELREKGLPRTLQLRLNFYDGVRQKNGALGAQYVLIPRLAQKEALVKANYAGTQEMLKHYLMYLYRQQPEKGHTLRVSRGEILAKANITNKNAHQATATLRKALDKLIADGTIVGYAAQIPTKAEGTFEIVLGESVG